jgi:glycosyltransferase involved in cell wall biosynthesis
MKSPEQLPLSSRPMRILILNWRCPKNPRAGGAEFLTHEVAKRLVADGNEVEWFSATFPGADREESLDGVRIVRSGRQWSVHLRAFARYFRRLRPHFDLVIDEVNTIPFLTPLWADVPVFMLIYQLAREVWWYESPFPISLLGFLLEPLYLRFYRKVPTFTESESTLRDLRRIGFSGSITVVPVGVDVGSRLVRPKPEAPNFLYVGRLAPSKRVNDIIRAFDVFRKFTPDARLWLVGDGSPNHVRSLRKLVARLHLENSVDFLGRVSRGQKHQRMAEAYALLMASVREGWGLVVTEANSFGTPAIVYDVPGLRDSVRHGRTGLIVSPTPEALAEGMLLLWKDRVLCERLAAGASNWSSSFTADRTVDSISLVLESFHRAGAA